MFRREEVESCLSNYYLKETPVKILNMLIWHIESKGLDYTTYNLSGIYEEKYHPNLRFIIANANHLPYLPLILEYFTNRFKDDILIFRVKQK